MPILQKKGILTLLLLLLLTGHSFLMNGYYSSHRYLTVATYFSSIRNLIDPELFKNSIYIQAVNRTNLRIGIFYDFLPYVLNYIELETFALLHTMASLFFMLAGIYALAITLTRSRSTAIVATILYTTQLNNWTLGSPAPYLNFFHHGAPYTYPLIVWSMLFFFRGRYGIALLLTGLSYNFHPMCTLFLLCVYGLYWLVNLRSFPFKLTMLYLAAFLLPALPGIAKTIHHLGSGGQGELWLEGVRWVSGYTNYPSTWSKRQFLQAGLFLILSCASLFAFPQRTIRRTVIIFWSAVAIMCLVGTICAEIIPIPPLIKLSLWRSTIIYIYLAIIIIAWASMRIARKSPAYALLAVTTITILTGYLPQLPYLYLAILLPAFVYALFTVNTDSSPRRGAILAGTAFALMCFSLASSLANFLWLTLFIGSTLLIIIISSSTHFHKTKTLLLWTIGLLIFDAAVLTAQGGPKIYYHGRIQGKLDPWADVQFVARDISDTDDLFIVPPFRNDFYHYSLRAVLGDWAEGSTLIFLDNRFTEEWFERMNDLGWTKTYNAEEGFNKLSTEDITRVALKYNAQFVVTEKPKRFELPIVYENSRFILYRTPCGNQ